MIVVATCFRPASPDAARNDVDIRNPTSTSTFHSITSVRIIPRHYNSKLYHTNTSNQLEAILYITHCTAQDHDCLPALSISLVVRSNPAHQQGESASVHLIRDLDKSSIIRVGLEVEPSLTTSPVSRCRRFQPTTRAPSMPPRHRARHRRPPLPIRIILPLIVRRQRRLPLPLPPVRQSDQTWAQTQAKKNLSRDFRLRFGLRLSSSTTRRRTIAGNPDTNSNSDGNGTSTSSDSDSAASAQRRCAAHANARRRASGSTARSSACATFEQRQQSPSTAKSWRGQEPPAYDWCASANVSAGVHAAANVLRTAGRLAHGRGHLYRYPIYPRPAWTDIYTRSGRWSWR